MSTRYASLGAGLRRSPKTSVVQPWFRSLQLAFVGGNSATVAYPATAHTKSAWTQIISSTAGNANWVALATSGGAFSAATLVDIGVGASGSEIAVVQNVAVNFQGNFGFQCFPVAIPSGSRVAVRMQGSATTGTPTVGVYLQRSEASYGLTPSSVTALGADTSTSTGTPMSGASGTWVQITSSTAEDYQNVFLMVQSAGNASTLTPTFTIGSGAAGSEVALASARVRISGGSLAPNAANPAINLCASGPVPAGTRLAVRHDIASNPGNFQVALYGVPYV